MKAYKEVECPKSQSMWGRIQHRTRLGAGLWFVSTAGHGGVWMSRERTADFRKLFPEFRGYSEGPWLEEDADASLAVLAFPECFSERQIASAVRSVTRSTDYFTQPREWLLSEAGKALRDIADKFIGRRCPKCNRELPPSHEEDYCNVCQAAA